MDKAIEIRNRILNNINIPLVDLYYFLNIIEIKFTTKINSAAITCSDKPQLLLNEEFINKYCKKDEHLLMLIMHEMYHYILGHTTLARGGSEIDNIVFDAVINATLSKMFNDEVYDEFFLNINPSSDFPACLLHAPTGKEDERYKYVLYQLYKSNTCTYKELYDLFKGAKLKGYVLIGNHQIKDNPFNPLDKEFFRKLNPNNFLKELGDSFTLEGNEKDLFVEPGVFNKENYIKVASFIKKAVVDASKSKNFGLVKTEVQATKETFKPTIKDRYALVKNRLLVNNLLHKDTYTYTRYTNDLTNKVLVYIDVSGSMDDELRNTLPILSRLLSEGRIELFQFSTRVYPLSYHAIQRREIKTTGGTDVNPVIRHLLNDKKDYKNAIIITDGYIPPIKQTLKTKLKTNNVNIYSITDNEDAKELFSISKEYLQLSLY